MKLFTRRITALLLVVCLIMPMLPVYAEGTQQVPKSSILP